ncbi:MAG: terminase small subunit [Alistipes indistinctus]
MSDDSVWCNASQLLSDTKVTQRVKELQTELQKASDISKERVLEELGAILEARITDYVNLVTERVPLPQSKREKKAGVPVEYTEVQKLVFKDFDQLTDRQVRAIESIKEGKNGIELKLHGKSWTIERISKMLGYDAPVKTANTDSKGNDIPQPTFSTERLFQLIKESGGNE